MSTAPLVPTFLRALAYALAQERGKRNIPWNIEEYSTLRSENSRGIFLRMPGDHAVASPTDREPVRTTR